MASDREPSAGEVERILSRHGYTVFRAHTGRIAFEAARSAQPEVLILDPALPDTDGFSLAARLRDDPEVGSSSPILMLVSTRPTVAEHRSAMRAGIWEFLEEPLNPEELTARVDAHVLTALESQQARPTAPLVDESGLYTPEGLARRARELALQAYHHRAGMACVVLSPERAEDVEEVGTRLKQATRRSDAVGRLSASAFAIVAPGTDRRGAVLLAERLAREIRQGGKTRGLRAGYDAVPDIRRAPLEPRHMLDRAAVALQRAMETRRGDWIRAYD